MMLELSVIGCVLAGGKSSRMGQDKALLPFCGRPMIQHIVEILEGVFSTVVISSNNNEAYTFLQHPTYADIFQNCGPLGGIHAVMVKTNTNKIFVTACDTPFLTTELIRYILNNCGEAEIAVTEMDGIVQPLCGLYSKKILCHIENNLRGNRQKMLELLKEVQTKILPITDSLPFFSNNLFKNYNTLDDLE